MSASLYCSKVLPQAAKIYWQSNNHLKNTGCTNQPWRSWLCCVSRLRCFCACFVAFYCHASWLPLFIHCNYSSNVRDIMNPSWTQQPLSMWEQATNTFEPDFNPTGWMSVWHSKDLQWSIPLATEPLYRLHIQTSCGQLEPTTRSYFPQSSLSLGHCCLNITCLRFSVTAIHGFP